MTDKWKKLKTWVAHHEASAQQHLDKLKAYSPPMMSDYWEGRRWSLEQVLTEMKRLEGS